MKIRILAIAVLMVVVFSATNVNADDIENPAISIISDQQFIDTANAHILMGSTFYIWQSYGKVRILYEYGNESLYDQTSSRGITKLALTEGAHLQVFYNGSLVLDVFTHADNIENFFKYQVSGVNALAFTVIVVLTMACLFEFIYWYKYHKRVV